MCFQKHNAADDRGRMLEGTDKSNAIDRAAPLFSSLLLSRLLQDLSSMVERIMTVEGPQAVWSSVSSSARRGGSWSSAWWTTTTSQRGEGGARALPEGPERDPVAISKWPECVHHTDLPKREVGQGQRGSVSNEMAGWPCVPSSTHISKFGTMVLCDVRSSRRKKQL